MGFVAGLLPYFLINPRRIRTTTEGTEVIKAISLYYSFLLAARPRRVLHPHGSPPGTTFFGKNRKEIFSEDFLITWIRSPQHIHQQGLMDVFLDEYILYDVTEEPKEPR